MLTNTALRASADTAIHIAHDTKQVVLAVLRLIENMLVTTAALVEQESQACVDSMTALLEETGTQQKHILHLIEELQFMHYEQCQTPLSEHLHQLHSTLTYSIGNTLLFSHYSPEWMGKLQRCVQNLHAANEHSRSLMKDTPAGLKDYMFRIEQSFTEVNADLFEIFAKLKEITPEKRMREIYSDELKKTAALVEHQPEKLRQITQLFASVRESIEQTNQLSQKAVMAIQFQDRNAQVTENAVRMLTTFRTLIENDQLVFQDDALTPEALFDLFYGNISMGDIRHALGYFVRGTPHIEPAGAEAESIELF